MRLPGSAPEIRVAYRARLASGAGYGPDHQHLLIELQQRQALQRNTDDGYWIAEADPAAAWQAITAQLDATTTPWAVLATNGAYKTMTHLGAYDWHSIQQPQGRPRRHPRSVPASLPSGSPRICALDSLAHACYACDLPRYLVQP
jgi:hypothetical protein